MKVNRGVSLQFKASISSIDIKCCEQNFIIIFDYKVQKENIYALMSFHFDMSVIQPYGEIDQSGGRVHCRPLCHKIKEI